MQPRWPENFAALRAGTGCPLCERSEDDLTEHGARFFEGRWSDAMLGRHPVRPGYSIVIWKGRHVTEPDELSSEEVAGFWGEVARVARALEDHVRPVKMNWLHLGNGVPHLHVHLVPRPADDARAGGPVEAEAFYLSEVPALDDDVLRVEAMALRARLSR